MEDKLQILLDDIKDNIAKSKSEGYKDLLFILKDIDSYEKSLQEEIKEFVSNLFEEGIISEEDKEDTEPVDIYTMQRFKKFIPRTMEDLIESDIRYRYQK